jgi:hypothetical protein
MENTEEVTDSDSMSHTSQGVETLEDSKLKERCGNVYEKNRPMAEFRIMNGEL